MYFFKTTKIKTEQNTLYLKDVNDKIKEEWEKAPMVVRDFPWPQARLKWENKNLLYRLKQDYDLFVVYRPNKNNKIEDLYNLPIMTYFEDLPNWAQFIFENQIYTKVNWKTMEDLEGQRSIFPYKEGKTCRITLKQYIEYGGKNENRVV